jgi:hypothetical protein
MAARNLVIEDASITDNIDPENADSPNQRAY